MAKMIALQLKAGDPAPAFSAPDQSGQTISLAGLKGKIVVLYFQAKEVLEAIARV
jgi:peroxiredoxin Q/BCP